MIWATVCSRSCFCSLYRASPSIAAKNKIILVLVLTIRWCPCVESSLVLLERGCLLWLVHSLGITLLAFDVLRFVLRSQICLLIQVSLNFIICISVPYNKKNIFWGGGVGSRRSCRSSYNHSTSASDITGQGIDLDYHDIEWFLP